MKIMLVVILAVIVTCTFQNEIFAEKNTFFDSVKFIQYLDENTALEEVRKGNLDIYYDTISADRLETQEGLQVFDATSRFYSILVNPAESEKFNPFSSKDSRFALNYLVDRKLIVNELMGGHGHTSIAYYGLTDPEFLTVIEELETFDFKYNPTLANEIISKELEKNGAIKKENKWFVNEEPIEVIIFIRSDDPIRKAIGEILSAELEKIGFTVKKDFGDLNKAFTVVYGSNPSSLKWNLYTEAWHSSAFVKYDSSGLGHMYSPWYSNMPGFNNPSYWNYNNSKLDEITQKIYTSDFQTAQQRAELIQDAIVEGIDESVRLFLAKKIDQYIVNEKVTGVVNDFGAGIPSRFTPINAKSDHDELRIGVKQIYQGAWNPVMGMTDSYSVQIWGIISDPMTFKHPFTGETIPIRASWEVDTAGPDNKLTVPKEAIIWNPEIKDWETVGDNTTAISKVTFDISLSKWHHKEKMDMNDIMHSLYFKIEWGTQNDGEDKTFDTEFTPRATQSIQTIKGVNPIDENTIEVYVDYWHFDEGEIAEWAEIKTLNPWEITMAMEQAVIDGKMSFSRSGAVSKNVNWLSLIIPNDANTIKEYLQEFKNQKYIPKALERNNQEQEYFQNRYDSSIKWIESNNHAVISNGPYYLESYSPESRTIKVNTFEDSSYPFKKGEWSKFENTNFPSITKIKVEDVVQKGKDIEIEIETENADSVLYFLKNGKNGETISNRINIEKNINIIKIESDEIEKFERGANNIKIFAMSNSVLKPDFYEFSFVITNQEQGLPEVSNKDALIGNTETNHMFLIIPIIGITGLIIYYVKKKIQDNP